MGQVHIGTLDAIDESWDVDGEIFPLTGWEIRQLSCMARKYLESIAAAPQPEAQPLKPLEPEFAKFVSENVFDLMGQPEAQPTEAAIKESLTVEDLQCSDHPDAPHGFDRNRSHNAGRYVCECEGWEPEAAQPQCWCLTCRPMKPFTDLSSVRMALCPECGNKRCPKANDHRHACTGSNEPGQPGSAYPAAQKGGV